MSRALFVFRLHALMRIGKYKHSMARFIVGVIFQFIGTFAFMGWALYLWIHVRHFGPENQCNDKVKYVIMFVDVEATEPWLRGIWIAIIAVSALQLPLLAGVDSYCRYFQHGIEKEGWYLKMMILRLLYVISLSPVPNAHRLPLRWAIYAIVTLELMVSILV
jgi:hypothetical protein